MIGISAQVSLYPLGAENIAESIASFVAVLDSRGVPYQMGDMSTVLWGDAEEVFAALRQAYEGVAESGAAVMVVTVSNACPVPSAPAGSATTP